MKTNLSRKRFWIMAAIALLCWLPAKAQNAGQWSLIPYVRTGVAFDFMYNPIDGMSHTDVGMTAKYNFNEHWSLLAGIEYEYRHDHSDNPDNWSGVVGPGHHHYFRVPLRVEFTYKWFFVNFGPYLERATQPWLTQRSYEHYGFGTSTEVGGRIRLTDHSHLRLGLQNQLGFDRITYHTPYHEEEHWTCKTLIDALLSVGYEVHF